jgi:hypothetical protein
MTNKYKAAYAVYDPEHETVLSSFVIAEFGGQTADWDTKDAKAFNAAEKCKQDWLRSGSRRLEICKIVRKPDGGFTLFN